MTHENRVKVLSENRKARFEYEIIETLQAGIILQGTEVKSMRSGRTSIAEAYATVENGGLWLINSHIPEYLQANTQNHDPRRRRKLLVHRRELLKLERAIAREGMTIVPLKVYLNGGRIKIDVAIAKGKKDHDKRQTIKERDWKRTKSRELIA